MAYGSIPKQGDPVHLSQFFLEDRRFPAVYFLWDDGVLVYIGQSKTLKWRIETHLTEGKKVFDSVSFIRCTIDRLMEIEGHFIQKFAPKYNDCAVANAVRDNAPWRLRSALTTRMLDTSLAADYLGVSESALRAIPEDILPRLRKRKPRSKKFRWLFDRADLETVKSQHPEFLTAS
ncbi:GIY-YIG nuclease family protein [Qipengyuania pacifica]|uniref:GIY-YIG nuclease family protein n=1 Tax=Qipengyuania pacifica TaxID=2860199 RepID=UPI001C9E193A|nr:GIY-YIG nuclease family protein [Qipengyuania pacifica]MBY8335191.1 GIY-YIG nuclease family protein [Qipengyuania pacifica]